MVEIERFIVLRICNASPLLHFFLMISTQGISACFNAIYRMHHWKEGCKFQRICGERLLWHKWLRKINLPFGHYLYHWQTATKLSYMELYYHFLCKNLVEEWVIVTVCHTDMMARCWVTYHICPPDVCMPLPDLVDRSYMHLGLGSAILLA